jgi:hypothetical protein
MSRDEGAAREQQRRRLEERHALASAIRNHHIGSRAARAGAKAASARRLGSLALALKEQEAEARRRKLEERMREAESRRTAGLLSPNSARMISPGTSPTVAPLQQSLTVMLEEPELPESDAAGAASSSGEPSPENDLEFGLRVEGFRRHVSSRKLQQCWRAFARKHLTTAALATSFASTGVSRVKVQQQQQSEKPGSQKEPTEDQTSRIPEHLKPAMPMVILGGISPSRDPRGIDPFDAFAEAIRDPATIKAAQLLTRRLEARLHASGQPVQNCSPLLRRLFPNNPAYQEADQSAAARSRHKRGSSFSGAPGGAAGLARGDRYPARVFLTAWMVVRYPEVVFSKMVSS